MATSKALSGNQIKLYLNRALYGYVISSTWDVSPNWREARTLDEVLPVELIPASYRVGGTLEVLRGRASGGLEGAGGTTFPSQFAKQKYVTLQLVDRVTDAILFQTERAQIISTVWRVTPKQLVVGNIAWVGTDFLNESYP